MKQIRKFQTAEGRIPFDEWIFKLGNKERAKVRAYVDRLAVGGAQRNVKKLKGIQGVFELRVDSGPGYRIYFGEVGREVILLLAGGIKKNQTRDIRLTDSYWRTINA